MVHNLYSFLVLLFEYTLKTPTIGRIGKFGLRSKRHNRCMAVFGFVVLYGMP